MFIELSRLFESKRPFRELSAFSENRSLFMTNKNNSKYLHNQKQRTLFIALNLARYQKITKHYFSSRVRKQFKLLTVPFKPLRCCLRSDKLANCHVWIFCKDLTFGHAFYAKFSRMIWSVVLFNCLNPFWFCRDHFVCIY